MKNALITIFAIILFSSCHSNKQQEKVSTDSVAANSSLQQVSELCFQRLEGLSNQDTSMIHLVIDNEKVHGNFNYVPYQKDSRRGTLAGYKNADIIKGIWTFMQEGMKDTLSVEFKLSGDELLQKTFGVDKNTGRQKLTDSSTFSIPYKKVACD